MGMIIVWALVRYRFPGRRLFDAIVDIPFALPTAVAGVALTQLFAQKGWLGAPLAELGIKVAFTPIGIFVAMVFIGIPFVVRTVQPVLIDLDVEIEEAAASLGANRWHTVSRVILPSLIPALLTGFALAFARAVGEYGSVIFIAGNLPNVSEIAPLLIVIRLSEFRYADATAIAVVMLVASFLIIFAVNRLQRWAQTAHPGALRLAMSRAADAVTEPAAGRCPHRAGPGPLCDRRARGAVPASCSWCCRWWWCSRRPFRKGVWRLFHARCRARSAVGDPADAADRGDLRHAQSGVRRDRGLGHRQIRVSAARPC